MTDNAALQEKLVNPVNHLTQPGQPGFGYPEAWARWFELFIVSLAAFCTDSEARDECFRRCRKLLYGHMISWAYAPFP